MNYTARQALDRAGRTLTRASSAVNAARGTDSITDVRMRQLRQSVAQLASVDGPPVSPAPPAAGAGAFAEMFPSQHCNDYLWKETQAGSAIRERNPVSERVAQYAARVAPARPRSAGALGMICPSVGATNVPQRRRYCASSQFLVDVACSPCEVACLASGVTGLAPTNPTLVRALERVVDDIDVPEEVIADLISAPDSTEICLITPRPLSASAACARRPPPPRGLPLPIGRRPVMTGGVSALPSVYDQSGRRSSITGQSTTTSSSSNPSLLTSSRPPTPTPTSAPTSAPPATAATRVGSVPALASAVSSVAPFSGHKHYPWLVSATMPATTVALDGGAGSGDSALVADSAAALRRFALAVHVLAQIDREGGRVAAASMHEAAVLTSLGPGLPRQIQMLAADVQAAEGRVTRAAELSKIKRKVVNALSSVPEAGCALLALKEHAEVTDNGDLRARKERLAAMRNEYAEQSRLAAQQRLMMATTVASALASQVSELSGLPPELTQIPNNRSINLDVRAETDLEQHSLPIVTELDIPSLPLPSGPIPTSLPSSRPSSRAGFSPVTGRRQVKGL